MRQGEPGDVVMILARGQVKVTRAEVGGTEMPLAIRAAGEMLGDIAVLHGTCRTSTVTTIADCEIRTITGARFRRFVNDHGLAMTILQLCHRRLQEGERDRTELVALPLTPRVCRMLDRLASPGENGTLVVDLAISQEEFGRMVGASRSTVGEVLNRLRRMGVVDTRRRPVVIHGIDALRKCSVG